MKQPWMKFYPTDWRADPALRVCSIGARGLWMEMLCLMHDAVPHGSLLVNGKPVTERQLANLCGLSTDEAVTLLAELEEAGVFSRDETGVIFSRRIRRDDEKATRDKTNGRKGGNPDLKGERKDDEGVNPSPNPKVEEGDKAQSPESRVQKEDEGTRASGEPLVTAEANELADEIIKIAGHDVAFVPPSWFGAPYRAQQWLNKGWPREIILLAVREQSARKRDGPAKSIQYFEQGIATAIARQNAPLPAVVPFQEARGSHEQAGNVIAASDRLLKRVRDFDQPAPTGICGGEGAAAVRLLPKG